MTLAELSGWWIFGWIAGGLVVLVAAVLLVVAVLLARRIGDQAERIEEALDGARANTDPLWDVKATNLAASRIVAGLRNAREELGR